MAMHNEEIPERRSSTRGGRGVTAKPEAVRQKAGSRRPPVTTLRVHHIDEAEKEPFHYIACGLDDVYLTNGYEIEKTPHGTGVSIRKVDEVLRAIGMFLVANKKQLSGKEIRFLRHQMHYTQSELARMLGVSSQQVARYEKDKNGSCISGASDRILRLLYREHIHSNVPIKDTLEGVDQMDDRVHRRMMFQHVNGTWKQAV
jgi:putative transcriptional regulator